MSDLPPLPFHVLSAFAPESGQGSQAALVIYPSTTDPRWLDEDYLRKVSADFNYTATVHIAPNPANAHAHAHADDDDSVMVAASVERKKGGRDDGNSERRGGGEREMSWMIRWFTPKSELALCGHGTISTSYILFRQYPELQIIQYENPIAGKFQSRRLLPDGCSEGVGDSSSGTCKEVEIELPNLSDEVISTLGTGDPRTNPDADALRNALGLGLGMGVGAGQEKDEQEDILDISEFKYGDKKSLIILLKGHVGLKGLNVDIKALGDIASGQIIVTQMSAESEESQSISENTLVIRSRMFAPGIGIQEDVITGSAHTYLTNYYLSSPATRFLPEHLKGKDPKSLRIQATQLSERGGGMSCTLGQGVVKLRGRVREFGRGVLVDDDDEDDD
ncbi:uncharacterized protein I303_100952 [Kwoniella dejecticola CBS 10117]|uniref:Phenazine biosynthesis protein n=1 Tax=Kwoniella dejecticola CBS 10117 TaxID=1296121 RepID=A0A1A6AGD9_9TREE|nr:uncharacterized protein I303_00956 [Kwoniella dejecticola CBS 10117]OBR89134.1 hypothetical protein I303_00956 [Kwoniella dejecticola CBS 10117]